MDRNQIKFSEKGENNVKKEVIKEGLIAKLGGVGGIAIHPLPGQLRRLRLVDIDDLLKQSADAEQKINAEKEEQELPLVRHSLSVAGADLRDRQDQIDLSYNYRCND